MLLSSIRRIRSHVMGMQSAPLSVSNDNDRLLKTWIASCSMMIEKYLDRSVEKTSYTEYFSLIPNKQFFVVKAYPVSTLTSVYIDSSALWTGDESEIEDCFTNDYANAVYFPYGFTVPGSGAKAVRVIYTGGLAAHPTNSTYTIAAAGQTGAWAVNSYVIGAVSGAVGVVVSYTAGTRALVVENYYGTFKVGEALTQTTAESSGSSTATGTLEAVSIESLADVAPDLLSACEMQVRYMWKHTTDFEITGTDKDGLTTRDNRLVASHLPLLPEVREILNPYRRVFLA